MQQKLEAEIKEIPSSATRETRYHCFIPAKITTCTSHDSSLSLRAVIISSWSRCGSNPFSPGEDDALRQVRKIPLQTFTQNTVRFRISTSAS